MNREIKFRGKPIEGELPSGEKLHGGFVYGSLLQGNGLCQILVPVEGAFKNYKVDPDTVGQFTGLCDANGREIYEGDVVNLCRTYRYDERFGIVTFHQEEVGFAALDISPFMNDEKGKVFWRMDKFFIEERKTKVIGNIHDNPELLKGGEK